MAALVDGGRARILALKKMGGGIIVEVEDNWEKVELFNKAFLYKDPELMKDEGEDKAIELAFQWMPITNREIYKAVDKLKPHKAQAWVASQTSY